MTLSTDHRSHDRPVVPDTTRDDVLLEAARDGDQDAFEMLRDRYRGTALAVARARTNETQAAEDVAASAFDRIEEVVSEGHGPQFLGAFTVWMVGREADGGTGPVALPEDPADPACLLRAVTRLPAKWQAFLWHTQIQGWSVRRAAVALGISPVAAVPLQRDIYTGLRRAYRHEGAGLDASAECAQCRGDIIGIVRDTLPLERRRAVQQHLDGCTSCTAEYLRLQDLGTGLRTWVLPVLAGLPLWGAEAAGLAGLIREADGTSEEDPVVAVSPRSARGATSMLGAGALVAAAAAVVVGLADIGDPVQDRARISAGEVAPADDDAGSGRAGMGSAEEIGAAPADEERTDPASAAPGRDDGWGPGEAASAVIAGAPGSEGEVGGTGAVPAGQELSASSGWTGSGTEWSAALPTEWSAAPPAEWSVAPPAAWGDALPEAPDTTPHDGGSVEAERSPARTPVPEPSPSRVEAAPSSVPSSRDPSASAVIGPAPGSSPAPILSPSPPSAPALTGEVRDAEKRGAEGRKHFLEPRWGGRAEQHREQIRGDDRGEGHHDSHRHRGYEHHGPSAWGYDTR